MVNEHDLLLAIMEIGRGDIGTGGLVTLAGKTVPIVKFADIARADSEGLDVEHGPPILTVTVMNGDHMHGTADQLDTLVQFDGVVEPGSEGLEAQMIDRIEQIMTGPNFAGEGLDVGVTKGQRRRNDNLESGRVRLTMDYTMLVRR